MQLTIHKRTQDSQEAQTIIYEECLVPNIVQSSNRQYRKIEFKDAN